MSERPASHPAYAALVMGEGTLAEAQRLGGERSDRAVDSFDDEVSAVVSLDRVAHSVETQPAPARPEPNRAYRRVLEELSQFLPEESADDVLESALLQVGSDRRSAEPYDFRQALVGPLAERLPTLLGEDRVDFVLRLLENAITDVHRPSRPRDVSSA